MIAPAAQVQLLWPDALNRAWPHADEPEDHMIAGAKATPADWRHPRPKWRRCMARRRGRSPVTRCSSLHNMPLA